MVLRTLKIAIVVGTMVTATGCLQRSSSEYPTGQNQGNQQGGQNYQQPNEFNGGGQNADPATSGQIPVKFDSASLAQAAAEIDLSKEIVFKLEYLDYDKSETAKVENGKVDVTFKDLPTDKEGTLTLSIQNEDKVAVFKGTKEKTTLKPGPNSIDIILRKVDPTTGKTTDVTLSVTLDDGADDADADANADADADADANGGDDAAIKDWDGESFQGNDKWEIKPVD